MKKELKLIILLLSLVILIGGAFLLYDSYADSVISDNLAVTESTVSKNENIEENEEIKEEVAQEVTTTEEVKPETEVKSVEEPIEEPQFIEQEPEKEITFEELCKMRDELLEKQQQINQIHKEIADLEKPAKRDVNALRKKIDNCLVYV